jgi:hypothetical protein
MFARLAIHIRDRMRHGPRLWAMTAIIVLLFAVPGQAARPTPRETVTVDYLYEACAGTGDPASARGLIPYFDCQSYVYGVLDAYLSVREALPLGNRACFPSSLSPWQAIEFGRVLLDDPSNGPKVAGPALITILAKTYPCK